MSEIRRGILKLEDLHLQSRHIHKLRGFIGNLFKDYDLIHNHDPATGKTLYRYPLIQFKLINDIPVILALGDQAITIFSDIFCKLDKIQIDNEIYPIQNMALQVETVNFGFSPGPLSYRFLSPWLALNQSNYKLFLSQSQEKNIELLEKILIGNILSISRGLNYWLEPHQRLEVKIMMDSFPSHLKGIEMEGFTGLFQVNFFIPDYFALGKSVSRGFGTVEKIFPGQT